MTGRRANADTREQAQNDQRICSSFDHGSGGMSRLWPNSGSQIGNESLASMTQAGWNVALCPIHAA